MEVKDIGLKNTCNCLIALLAAGTVLYKAKGQYENLYDPRFLFGAIMSSHMLDSMWTKINYVAIQSENASLQAKNASLQKQLEECLKPSVPAIVSTKEPAIVVLEKEVKRSASTARGKSPSRKDDPRRHRQLIEIPLPK
jgi:hypothetical protein